VGQEGRELCLRDDVGGRSVEVQTRERGAGVKFHLLQRVKLVQMQSYRWGEMLLNAAQLAGGRQLERITVRSWPTTAVDGEAELGR
jgi:hypothetical protein